MVISEEKELESEEINIDSQTESISKKDPDIVQEESEDSCMIIIRDKSIKYNNSICKDLTIPLIRYLQILQPIVIQPKIIIKKPK